MNAIARWFIDNPIAAKIIMLVILTAGVFSYPLISKEYFPNVETDSIRITVPYPGAGPEEVESQICRRIEEAVKQIGGIEEIRSTAREGLAEVVIEIKTGEDTLRVLNDVRANVDGITTFPVDSERPLIVENRWEFPMMSLQLAGELDERSLKELGEEIREELAMLPSVSKVKLRRPRAYEVSIEVSENALREYQLGFEDIATAIRAYSVNLPAGKVRDPGGDIPLQIRAQADVAIDFEQIPLLQGNSGALIRIADVAKVIDGFEDFDYYSALNGKPSLQLDIINQARPNILRTSAAVKAYIEQKQATLPDAVELTVWTDASVSYRGRLDTLIYNGSSGLLLVFIVLVIFLRPVLALWVCLGIAVAFLGALWGLSLSFISLNVMSMFAFIMILGIVVDDAIIVGESVYSQQQLLKNRREGAIKGVRLVMSPVLFAVASTIVFFIPFFYLTDRPPTSNIALPVILALCFSLVESLLLLPSHLAGKRSGLSRIEALPAIARVFGPLKVVFAQLEKRRAAIGALLPHFANGTYRRFLLRATNAKRYTFIVFVFLLLFAAMVVKGGWLPFYFFPRVTSQYVMANATLPEAAPYAETFRVMEQMNAGAEHIKQSVNAEFGYELIQKSHATAWGNTAAVMMLMDDSSDRPISAQQVASRWRTAIGDVQGVTDLTVNYTFINIDKPIELVVRSDSDKQLKGQVDALVERLKATNGVVDVRSSLESPSNEISISLNDRAHTLAVNLQDVSRQIRRGFYGEEVQRIPRQREDVRVMVRYPRQDRSYQEVLQDMYISKQLPSGRVEIPLVSLVDIEYQRSYKRIDRLDGNRTAKVSADVIRGFSADQIIKQAFADIAVYDQPRYPDVTIGIDGEARETSEFFDRIFVFFTLSMLVIYGLIAVMFRSYWQPLLVLSAVPFGFMGGVFGHVIANADLTMMSMLGMLACAGVVVNDNVVLIDRINQLRAAGSSARRAVTTAAVQRFRPIVLTSATTFLGLTPILLETSFQAQFLIPMVASLSFGVLFATLVTLILVPTMYLMGDGMVQKIKRIAHTGQVVKSS